MRRFLFPKPPLYGTLYSMRFSKRLVIFMMICALAGQGIVPGLVLCRGEQGHAAVEVAFDLCCTAALRTSVQTASAYSLDAVPPPLQDGCGPCSDIPILANPLRSPSHEWNASLDYGLNAPIAIADVSEKIMAHYWLDPLIHPLIPITVSVLLI
jgi:hypothetical protein